MYPFTFSTLIRPFTRPKPRYIWAQIRILHETDKAVLVHCYGKHWIPKSRIRGVRLRNNVFEVYVEECVVG
jgi:hypothetical protein